MKIDTRFPLQVAATVLVFAALGAYPLFRLASWGVIMAVLIGAALSTLNVIVGFVAIEYAFEKSYTVFLRTVLGGMGIRLVLLLGALTLFIVFLGIHAVALTVSVLAFYLIFLILEVLFIQRKVLVNNQG